MDKMENPRENDYGSQEIKKKKSPLVASPLRHDFSDTLPSINSDCAFPMRLHAMINWIEGNFPRSSGPIYWLNHGRAFVIQDHDALATRWVTACLSFASFLINFDLWLLFLFLEESLVLHPLLQSSCIHYTD